MFTRSRAVGLQTSRYPVSPSVLAPWLQALQYRCTSDQNWARSAVMVIVAGPWTLMMAPPPWLWEGPGH